MAQTPGILRITWNRANIAVEKGATYKPAGNKANPVVLGTEVNHSFEFQQGSLKATTALKKGQRFLDLYQPGPGELIVRLDTGHVFSHPDAVLMERPEMNSEGGKVALEWFFGEGMEQ
ncbi:phage tail tube protein [Roseomonas sp. HJA6]|uniref:Phage tail tube protein n=1 Tax=Roseomonas alba TaxID=2846776 RepID=A0ABS7AJW5_9PROT|nr:phage tail tube protein [Neoroseomonas alba]MBW6402032.1 phage tail tube protein [Neoroseomonas alba]